GIRVPVLRAQTKRFQGLPLTAIRQLLDSPLHEERLCALLLLVRQFEAGDAPARTAIYRLYLEKSDRINNWDLVDSSAPQIVGAYLSQRKRSPLYRLAVSQSLWERRIAIMSTFHFIRQGDFDDTLALSDLLLDDPHELIHKAVGWMLREVGNRDGAREREFLKPRYRRMPRTLLRYAIEKFPERERQRYLKSRI
ncbi:MAG: DNA alkylation repair protein, partial [Candidatus Thiodiazotropha sp.]